MSDIEDAVAPTAPVAVAPTAPVAIPKTAPVVIPMAAVAPARAPSPPRAEDNGSKGAPQRDVEYIYKVPLPTDVPTRLPTDAPTRLPTDAPTRLPTDAPTRLPSALTPPSLRVSLLLPLRVFLLYSRPPPCASPYCCPYASSYCTLVPLPARREVSSERLHAFLCRKRK